VPTGGGGIVYQRCFRVAQRVYSIMEFADHQLRRRGDVDADFGRELKRVAGSSTLNLSASIAAANGSTYKRARPCPWP